MNPMKPDAIDRFRSHQLTFRMPTGFAVCLVCLRALTVDDLARPCPGPAPTEHFDADIVHVSRNLANRDLLRDELGRVDADTYLVELKAAAIDVVAEHALARGARVMLADNEVVAPALDDAILALVPEAVST